MANKQVTMEALLNEVVALRTRVEELMASKPAKAAKASKPKDPDAPKKAPNAWIVFTGRVRTVLKDNGLPAGREAQQYASFLKNTYAQAYEMTPEAILSHHAEWTPPDPKPKEEAEAKPKPKRTITPEHLAKMQAGKRAAAERRKAEEAAAKAAEAEVEDVESEAEEAAPASKPAPKELKVFPYKGKKLLKDPKTGGCWENKDGVPGEWKGVYNAETKTLDASVPEPE